MTMQFLRERVEARDSLVQAAETTGRRLRDQAAHALRQGHADEAASVVDEGASAVQRLAEDLRTYQAELHAQAEELQASQIRTEQALARFQALFGNLPVAALRVALNGEVLDANQRAARQFAFRPHAHPNRFLHRMVDPAAYQSVVRPAFYQARAAGAAICEDIAFLRDDGSSFEGEMHLSVLPSGGTDLATGEFACVVIDRSAQRHRLASISDSHAKLAANEASLSDSARLARIGGFSYLPDAQTMQWSPQLCTLLDLPEGSQPTVDEVFGWFMPAARPALRHAFETATRYGVPFDLDAPLTTPTGRELLVRVVGRPQTVDGRCSRLVGVVQDLGAPLDGGRHPAAPGSPAPELSGIGLWEWDLAAVNVVLDARTRVLLGVGEASPGGLPELLSTRLDADGRRRFQQALERSVHHGEPLDVALSLLGSEDTRRIRLTGHLQLDPRSGAARLVGCAWEEPAGGPPSVD